jgi:hypothetical protein
MNKHDLLSREKTLRRSLKSLRERGLTKDEAIRALEICAGLIESDNRPRYLDYDEASALVRSTTGRDLESFKSDETIRIGSMSDAPSREVSLIRGVRLQLIDGMKLHSIVVLPAKLAERQRLLAIVGIGSDTATDVAENHDEYLAQIYGEDLHGERRTE